MSFRKGEILCREDMAYPEGALAFDGYDEAGSAENSECYSLLSRAVVRSSFAGSPWRRRQTMFMGRLPSWLT